MPASSFPAAFEATLFDLRYSVRSLVRTPLFTALVVLTLAVGIGATTAVFSVVDRILFRSLPYANSERLASFGLTGPIDENEFMLAQSYVNWYPHLAPFESATSMSPWLEGDLGDQNPVRIRAIPVQANFLSTLGLKVASGRDFTPDDDRPNAPRVALLSYALWQSHFGRSPALLGQVITLDDQRTRIIGVLPPEFELPTLGRADVLIPQQLDWVAALHGSQRFLRTFARLKPGVSAAQARQQLQPLFQTTLQTEVPPSLRPEVHLALRSLRDRQVSDVRLASWLLFAAVLAFLSLACANVTNLLLGRSAARQREWAMRAALGASRLRLLRLALVESSVVALAGAVAGCVLARGLLYGALALAPEGLLLLAQARLNSRVLLFALGVSLFTGIVFGLAPALTLPSAKALTGWHATGSQGRLLRPLLVALQIALSLVLLTGAGLFTRSLLALQHQSPGLERASVLTASFELSHHAYQNAERLTAFYNQLETKLQAIPGVTRMALADSIPPGGWAHSRPFSNLAVLGRPAVASTGGSVVFRSVTPDYFRILHMRMLAGHTFSEVDRTPSRNSIVLSALLARRLFGNLNPLGQAIVVDPQAPPLTVIGVAADVSNNGLANPPDPEYYRARKHSPDFGLGSRCVVLLEGTVPQASLSQWVRSQTASLDPHLALKIETLRQHVDQQQDRPRFLTLLFGVFAILGLLLAAIGLYGVLAFLVQQQTREIGVRVAIGATSGNIARLILGRAATWTAAGMALGLAASLLLARVARSLLFGVSPGDPLSILMAGAVLAAAAFLAALWPARRAWRVDPAVLLRAE